MRFSSLMLRAAAVLALGAALHAQTATTFTGKVYSPNGPVTGDPIPNILVFAVNPAYPPPVFSQGIVQGGSCAQQPSLVPSLVLGSAISDYTGSFTFTTTQPIPNPVTIVIQAGKWRRKYQFDSSIVTPGTVNTLPALVMPGSQSQGDLPHIAVVTGGADGIECIFRQIGIADTEVTAPGGAGSINLYPGDGTSGGATVAGSTPLESSLVANPSTMSTYDVVMFGCEGNANDPDVAGNGANLVNFANSGGRVFATHYGYVWLDGNGSFNGAADWTGNSIGTSLGSAAATINTSYPEGAILGNWMNYIGALTSNAPPVVTLTNVRVNTNGVNNPPAQSWVSLNNSSQYSGNPSMQFTFDTPVGTGSMPTVAISFTNNSSKFLAGDPADSVTVDLTNNSGQAADTSLTLTIALPNGLVASSATDASAGGWVCSIASATNILCTRTAPLPSGASDNVNLTFSIPSSAPVGSASVSASIAGGGLSDTSQCGRVLYNDYHVEEPPIVMGNQTITKNTAYPSECSGGTLNAVEKFLEFSLYNLSNFVYPSATDTILIQGIPTLTWATPAAIYYGTPLSATQLDATATYNGVAVPGTFTYTPPAGTIEPVGNNQLSAIFNPTNTADYIGGTITTQLQVLQDTTTTNLTSFPNPSDFNQSVVFTATVVGNAAAPTGPVTFYDAGVSIGTAMLAPTGVADTSAAIVNISTLAIGQHNITAGYANTTDFGPSASGILVQEVLAPSTTTVTGLTSPIYYGQIIGDTAVITVNGSSSGGTIKAYIDNVLVCTLPAGPTMACPPSTGAGYNAGNHTFYAVFSGDAQFSGSTSPTYTVQILPDITQITVASLLNPSILGQSVTFQATMSGNFATPTGTITFYDGTTAIGTGTLAATSTTDVAIASFATSALAVGSHNITVGYAATQNFNAAVSAPPVVQVVNPPPPNGGLPGFGMTVSPTNVSVGVGNTLGISVTIVEYNGFSAPTQLACSGLPIEATCTFVHSTIPAGGGTTTLFVSPASPHSCTNNTPDFIAPNPAGGVALLGLAMVLARKRRKLFRGLALAAGLMALPVLQGCGANCLDLGTKPGTYTFTVTGTAAGAQPTPSRTQVVTMNATI